MPFLLHVWPVLTAAGSALALTSPASPAEGSVGWIRWRLPLPSAAASSFFGINPPALPAPPPQVLAPPQGLDFCRQHTQLRSQDEVPGMQCPSRGPCSVWPLKAAFQVRGEACSGLPVLSQAFLSLLLPSTCSQRSSCQEPEKRNRLPFWSVTEQRSIFNPASSQRSDSEATYS